MYMVCVCTYHLFLRPLLVLAYVIQCFVVSALYSLSRLGTTLRMRLLMLVIRIGGVALALRVCSYTSV